MEEPLHNTMLQTQTNSVHNQPVVQLDSFLTLHYRLSGLHGDVINTFDGQPATLSMGAGSLAEPLEKCLLGLQEGCRTSFHLAAGEVFGEHNPAMQQWLKHSELVEMGDPQDEYAVGEVLQFPTPDGAGVFAGTVVEVGEQAILFDFNHPLAGQAMTFEVQVISIL